MSLLWIYILTSTVPCDTRKKVDDLFFLPFRDFDSWIDWFTNFLELSLKKFKFWNAWLHVGLSTSARGDVAFSEHRNLQRQQLGKRHQNMTVVTFLLFRKETSVQFQIIEVFITIHKALVWKSYNDACFKLHCDPACLLWDSWNRPACFGRHVRSPNLLNGLHSQKQNSVGYEVSSDIIEQFSKHFGRFVWTWYTTNASFYSGWWHV